MEALASTLGRAAFGVVAGMASKLATEEFIRWALLRIAKILVERTETKEDDEWLSKIEELVK